MTRSSGIGEPAWNDREAAYFRAQAARCRRIAGCVLPEGLVRTLHALAADYDAEAARYEATKGPVRPWHGPSGGGAQAE